uniref:Ovule protein n=1 Tax=Heterorhabditis bacteriophora TaxID=37862 RepID=A0A1I7X9G0_HETBA
MTDGQAFLHCLNKLILESKHFKIVALNYRNPRNSVKHSVRVASCGRCIAKDKSRALHVASNYIYFVFFPIFIL